MGEQLAVWYREQGEYLLGALFGLFTLDLFMFLAHCVTERTTDGYGLTTLLISLSFLMVAYLERLYMNQAEGHY